MIKTLLKTSVRIDEEDSEVLDAFEKINVGFTISCFLELKKFEM